jgi:hypothetical protein
MAFAFVMAILAIGFAYFIITSDTNQLKLQLNTILLKHTGPQPHFYDTSNIPWATHLRQNYKIILNEANFLRSYVN